MKEVRKVIMFAVFGFNGLSFFFLSFLFGSGVDSSFLLKIEFEEYSYLGRICHF